MPTPIALTKVNIAGFRYMSSTRGEVTEQDFLNGATGTEVISKRIKFDTPSGELTDGQYATQANGYHWVKIPGYEVIKIDPTMVSKDKTTVEGLNRIIKDSPAE